MNNTAELIDKIMEEVTDEQDQKLLVEAVHLDFNPRSLSSEYWNKSETIAFIQYNFAKSVGIFIPKSRGRMNVLA